MRTVVRPPNDASRQTTVAAAIAPTNAASGSTAGRVTPPSAIARTAASDAPAEVPVTYGSASGLRNSPCKSAPATPSAPPISAAATTRGTRRSRTMVPLVSFVPPQSADHTSPGESATAPMRMAAAELPSNATTRTAMPNRVVTGAPTRSEAGRRRRQGPP